MYVRNNVLNLIPSPNINMKQILAYDINVNAGDIGVMRPIVCCITINAMHRLVKNMCGLFLMSDSLIFNSLNVCAC